MGRPVILNIEEVDSVSPTGTPGTASLGRSREPRVPRPVATLQRFGTTQQPLRPGADGLPRFQDDRGNHPVPRRGSARQLPRRPYLAGTRHRVGGTEPEVMDAASPEAAQQIVANDVRLAGLFQDIADQRKTCGRHEGDVEHGGWVATQKLFSGRTCSSRVAWASTRLLPHLSRYNVLSIGTFIQDLQEAIDPATWRARPQPHPDLPGPLGARCERPGRVDTCSRVCVSADRGGLPGKSLASGTTFLCLPSGLRWTTGEVRLHHDYMATQNQAQYVAPDRTGFVTT